MGLMKAIPAAAENPVKNSLGSAQMLMTERSSSTPRWKRMKGTGFQ
jgi:hypothetical protein